MAMAVFPSSAFAFMSALAAISFLTQSSHPMFAAQ